MNIMNIEGDEIVIRVPIDALPDIAATAFDHYYGFDKHRIAVVDSKAFAKDLVEQLSKEDDCGNTMVTRTIDFACLEAESAGAEGLAR